VKLVLLDALLLLHPPVLEPDLHLRPETPRISDDARESYYSERQAYTEAGLGVKTTQPSTILSM